MAKFTIYLKKFEKTGGGRHCALFSADARQAVMEFHIRREVREEHRLEEALFSLRGNVVLADMRQVRDLTAKFNAKLQAQGAPADAYIKAGELFAMGLIDEILHYLIALYREQVQPDAFNAALSRLERKLGDKRTADLLNAFSDQFPPQKVYAKKSTIEQYLAGKEGKESCRALSLEETMMLSLANLNPAFKPFGFLFSDTELANKTVYPAAIEELKSHFAELPPFGPDGMSLWDLLRAPALASPDSLAGQLEFMRKKWGLLISRFMSRLLMGLDVIKEENKPSFFGPGPMNAYDYSGLDEYERFSPDQDWMPRTVLMAKSTLVWLYQLSKKYGREIVRLDQIPDEELDELSRRGFTGLWLIGLWERSNASKTIKQWTGNPEAAASAYSLYDYDIAGELGGWGALLNLRERCIRRGIRIGSDMVPNHTGIDSRWMIEHPDRFLQLSWPPFPNYNYNCGNLSGRDDITVQIEEHYFTRTDAAVVFKRIDNHTGEVRYIYHGNDGTSMPWNDTAQIDFLNPEAREAVIATIVGVCKQFPIVRFDAAMTLAKRHIQRLWYPEPGRGGDIASRSEHAISNEEFNRRIPNEFWREVVDRCAVEAPNTLLLAEAFWMMEGYFVRTLGMHRVYNSAFMNMLKNEDNAKYRATIKNTLEFDPEILKRFVNFMNNPDEDTAVAQFGKGDKYFGICTLLVTMPGLPMFGHGQIEGFEEKYGMEYRRSYKDEQPDGYLVDRHEREIFPLMKRRALFSGSVGFRIFDLWNNGAVNENVFAYTNRLWDEKALVFYNNSYYEASGWIKQSTPAIPQEDGSSRQDTLSEALSIHGESRFFTLMREQRSGLWFIRSSKDIAENGFFVVLKGYEAQVFLDIHEVEDGAGDTRWARKWAELNHSLDGRGAADLDAAMMDIFLGDLYYRFTEIFKPELVQEPETLRAGTLREPFLAFVETAKEYLKGAGGNYDPWSALDDEGKPVAYTAVENEEIAREFEAYLTRFTHAAGSISSERPAALTAALIYGVLSMLRLIIGAGAGGKDAVALGFTHWKLERKIRELLRMYGGRENELGNITDIMKAVLQRTAPADSSPFRGLAASPGKLGAAVILDNYAEEDFRRILGVNRFEEVTWFNKEAFEETLFYASLFLSLEGDDAFIESGPVKTAKPLSGEKRSALIKTLGKEFTRAEKLSGFRLDQLTEALAGGMITSTASAAKKPAAKTETPTKAGKSEKKK